MENKKFELTSETKVKGGKTRYRIKALISFGGISKGDLGGWVEKESNISMSGNAWVSGDADVSGDAWVSGNAQVFGDAQVFGNARVSGNAWVFGNARVFGNAEVFGSAQVFGNAQVSGDAEKTPIHISGLAYGVTITDEHIKIGCEFHLISEWAEFNDDRIKSMDGDRATKFWSAWKDSILKAAKNHTDD